MKNFKIFGLVAVLAVLVVGVILFTRSGSKISENNSQPNNQEFNQTEQISPNQTAQEQTSQELSATITYTDSGFSPVSIPVKKGTVVVFKNESSKNMWPASAMHPTHKVYPGSGIEKCGMAEEANIFDACRGIQLGGSWSFKFVNVGTWKYHDHLDATKFGTIVVIE